MCLCVPWSFSVRCRFCSEAQKFLVGWNRISWSCSHHFTVQTCFVMHDKISWNKERELNLSRSSIIILHIKEFVILKERLSKLLREANNLNIIETCIFSDLVWVFCLEGYLLTWIAGCPYLPGTINNRLFTRLCRCPYLTATIDNILITRLCQVLDSCFPPTNIHMFCFDSSWSSNVSVYAIFF